MRRDASVNEAGRSGVARELVAVEWRAVVALHPLGHAEKSEQLVENWHDCTGRCRGDFAHERIPAVLVEHDQQVVSGAKRTVQVGAKLLPRSIRQRTHDERRRAARVGVGGAR